jgi:hypothetical protein
MDGCSDPCQPGCTPIKEIQMQALRGKAPKYVVAGLAFLMLLGAAAPMLRSALG